MSHYVLDPEVPGGLGEQAYELNPSLTVQPFAWLQLTGEPGVDDFADDRGNLVVSERALAVLREHAQLSLCDIEPWAR